MLSQAPCILEAVIQQSDRYATRARDCNEGEGLSEQRDGTEKPGRVADPPAAAVRDRDS